MIVHTAALIDAINQKLDKLAGRFIDSHMTLEVYERRRRTLVRKRDRLIEALKRKDEEV